MSIHNRKKIKKIRRWSAILPKEPYKRIPVILFYAAFSFFSVFVFFKWLFPVLFPFLLAWVIALLLQPVVSRLVKAKIPRFLSSSLLVILFVSVLGFICYLIVSRLYSELSLFASNAADFLTRAWNDDGFASGVIAKIDDALPFFHSSEWLESVWKSLGSRFNGSADGLITSLTTRILPILGDFLAFLPDALMYVLAFTLSCYYFTLDFDRINRTAVRALPEKAKKLLSDAKSSFKGTLGKLIGAYSLIILITFTELFIALSLIGVRYSLVIAFLTSLVDILPLLGTGTVLIPWGLFELVFGSTAKGIGLLVTYGIITVVRELIEPKIVGKTMGLHPLLALFSMYAGLRFFGVAGLMAFPVLVTFAKNILAKANN